MKNIGINPPMSVIKPEPILPTIEFRLNRYFLRFGLAFTVMSALKAGPQNPLLAPRRIIARVKAIIVSKNANIP